MGTKNCPYCKLPIKAPKILSESKDIFPTGCTVKTLSTGKRWRYRVLGYLTDSLLDVVREPDGQRMTIRADKCTRVCDCTGRSPRLRWKLLTKTNKGTAL